MQITMDDLDEIVDALVQWQKIWTGVRLQRAEWVRSQTARGDLGFAKHNQEAYEKAKKHCEITSKLINKLQSFQDKIEDIKEWAKEEPKEILVDCSCSVDYPEEVKE